MHSAKLEFTFLFTDIEDYSDLIHSDPARMAIAMPVHDSVDRKSVV